MKAPNSLLLEKENEFQSSLITAESAQRLVPHLCLKQLLKTQRIRGIKYQGRWYYAKKDLEEIAKAEHHYISPINKFLEKQNKRYRIEIHTALTRAEILRGRFVKSAKFKNHTKLIKELDKLINRLEQLYQKIREENKR